jgi:hypothetical protein
VRHVRLALALLALSLPPAAVCALYVYLTT